MNVFIRVFAVSFLTLSGACAPYNLNPLVTEKDAVIEKGLLGEWIDKKEKMSVIIRQGESKNYDILFKGETKSEIFFARSIRLNNQLFLDVEEPKDGPFSDLNQSLLNIGVPAHIILKVWLSGDELRFEGLMDEWLKNLVAHKKLKVPYLILQNSDMVLTGSTKELQKFIASVANNPQAFPKPDKFMVRKKTEN